MKSLVEQCSADGKLHRCEGCPFKGRLVGERGPIDSPFVIIGESPGKEEVKEGKPFVGPSWTVLQNALKEYGNPDLPEPYILNSFQCWPGNNKTPDNLPLAVSACRDRAIELISAYPRKVILALGNGAVWSITGNYGLKITKVRGTLFDTPLATRGMVSSVHPAFLLRGGGSWRQFKADCDYALSLLDDGPIRKTNPTTVSYKVVSREDVAEIAKFLHSDIAPPLIAADCETDGFDHVDNRILELGFSWNGKQVYVVPEDLLYEHPEAVKPLFDGFQGWVWHNGKFDVKFLKRAGFPAKVHEDTMLMSYALDEMRGVHDLETVAGDWLYSPSWKNMLESYLNKKSDSYRTIPTHIRHKYLSLDVANTFDLHQLLRPKVQKDKFSERQYSRTLIPASSYLADVEDVGIEIDVDKVQENTKLFLGDPDSESKGLIAEAATPLQEIARQYGMEDINPNSHIQLSELVFDRIQLKNRRGLRSTQDSILKTLAPAHPIVPAIQGYRKVAKAYSTYVKPAFDWISGDGRCHSTYLIHGTATGRLASRDPNLQNIPRDPKLRGQFKPRKGFIFLEPDLNQAELRSLACLSGDPELCKVYEDGTISLHELVRSDIWGSPADWTDEQIKMYMVQFFCTVDRIAEEQKMRAKAVNFGIVYGREAFSLAEEFKISPQEAQRWINSWFQRFPVAHEFIEKCRSAPVKGWEMITVFGYRKRFGVVSQEILKSLQNESANFPHQSIASTITLHAGIRCYEAVKDFNARIVNTVHDSILIEVPQEESKIIAVADLVMKELTQVPIDWGLRRIPFVSDAKIGPNGESWGALSGYSQWLKSRS